MESLSPESRRLYDDAFADFVGWCQERGLTALPAGVDTVAVYIGDRTEGLSTSALKLRRAAIRRRHLEEGLPSPTDDDFFRGMWRELLDQRKERDPRAGLIDMPTVLDEPLKAMVLAAGDDLVGRRDRALLLVGVGAALQRREVALLGVEDVDLTHGECRVILNESGDEVELRSSDPRFDPRAAVEAWREGAGVDEGRLFRAIDKKGRVADEITEQGVGVAVRRAAERAGIEDPRYLRASILRARLRDR